MSSFAAQLLNELMGSDRDRNPNEKRREARFDDPETCKYFLCGFCPSELFTNTRADLGSCEKLHDEEMKKKYEASSRFGNLGYEEDFMRYLNTLLSDVDRRISKGHARLALNQQAQGALGGPQAAREEKIQMLSEKINDLIEQAELLGCEGKVEEAQGVLKLCEQLKEERSQLHTLGQRQDQAPTKDMEVCNVCGALLVVGDAQQRIDEHIMGKQHMGYARIRGYIEKRKMDQEQEDQERANRTKREREERDAERQREMEERQRQRDEREKEREKERDERRRKRSRSRSRDKRRRSRSRDRKSRRRSRSRGRRSRSRSRERRRRSRSRERRSRHSSRDRDHKRSHSHERGSSRSKKSHDRDRSRDRSRSKKRDRSKDREGSKARDRSRDKESSTRDRSKDKESPKARDHSKDKESPKARDHSEDVDEAREHSHDGENSREKEGTHHRDESTNGVDHSDKHQEPTREQEMAHEAPE